MIINSVIWCLVVLWNFQLTLTALIKMWQTFTSQLVIGANCLRQIMMKKAAYRGARTIIEVQKHMNSISFYVRGIWYLLLMQNFSILIRLSSCWCNQLKCMLIWIVRRWRVIDKTATLGALLEMMMVFLLMMNYHQIILKFCFI